jgi:predicted nucleotidyltransferase
MKREETINCLKQHAAEIRNRFKVKRLAVFGSTIRGEATATSDVDIVVEFDGAADLDRFMDLKFFLENTLNTRVDLVTHKAIRPRMRQMIESEAVDVA